MKDERLICSNLAKSEKGELIFAGVKASSLAKKYGTPLYIMDENRIREKCKAYINAVKENFGENGKVLYASKACSFKKIYEIVESEGLCTDVVSVGEIHTAKSAGFNLENAYFHSNNKTDYDIRYAMERQVGYFVTDNEEELYAIERIAPEFGRKQKIILRITPGIDCHTYEAVNTGKVDSKFGSAIETGQAENITRIALSMKNIDLCGFHCHVGSEVFDSDTFIASADIMMNFIADIKNKTGYEAEILDLGGGYGVKYLPSQPELDIAACIKAVADFVKIKAEMLNIKLPVICFEPGRSIVADSGITLYSVGTVKTIPGYKTYVSVDGGMTDNIRFALYGAKYTIFAADKMDENCDMIADVVGRCCESGDIIQNSVPLPSSIKRNDIIAVLITGAYHHSMASNYNRIPRIPTVILKDGKDYIAVRRETPEDVIALDV